MKNTLLARLHELKTQNIKSKFPELISEGNSTKLSLHKYLSDLPERFFSHGAFEAFYRRLGEINDSHRLELETYCTEHLVDLDGAFHHARAINALDWHDRTIEREDDYQVLMLIDRDIHPAYLRLVEAVFQPLLRIAAYFSRLEAGKGTQGLNLFNIVNELKGTDFNDVTDLYEHVMRNGIAHGGVRYVGNEIIYRDSKSNELALKGNVVVRKFDDLLDACNGLLLAYSMFALTRNGQKNLAPQNLLIEELRAETRTPYWEVKSALPSIVVSGQTQLIIYCDVRTTDNSKVLFSTVQTAIQAEQVAPGYDRYFVSMRAKNGLPGMASFIGKKLEQHRLQNHESDRYADVMQDYSPLFLKRNKTNNLFNRFETLKYAIEVGLPVIGAEYRLRTSKPKIVVRGSSIHRNLWGVVLRADVVLSHENSELDQDTIRNNCRVLVKRAKRHARKQVSRFSPSRYLPLGFADIHVFRCDYRARRLSGFGLGEDLIGTVRLQRIHRIKSPDIVGSLIENYKVYRIAWNRRWLER